MGVLNINKKAIHRWVLVVGVNIDVMIFMNAGVANPKYIIRWVAVGTWAEAIKP